MGKLSALEPKNVFYYFEELSNIPNGENFDCKLISDYCVEFAKERKLDCVQDALYNVIIKKSGTVGYEDSKPLIMQGHLDMICEKYPESTHDFATEGLELCIDGDWVYAKETSLGADNRIAIAMILAVLDSKDIPHPPIEAIFTVDEEGEMSGAENIDLSSIKGERMLNLDLAEDTLLTVGSAGGISCEVTIPVTFEEATGHVLHIDIRGLLGGHSGAVIHLQRGNALKMMGRLVNHLAKEMELKLVSIFGNGKENAVSVTSTAEILLDKADVEKAKTMILEMQNVWMEEFMGDEPDLVTTVEDFGEKTVKVFNKASAKRVLSYLVLCPDGMKEANRKLVGGLPEASLNLGYLTQTEDSIIANHLVRSSQNSQQNYIVEQLEICAELVGAGIKAFGSFPAWKFRLDSELRKVIEEEYVKFYDKQPNVCTVHGGLECSMFLQKKPSIDCVSIGAEIPDIHTFDEKLSITSTKNTWELVKRILEKLK